MNSFYFYLIIVFSLPILANTFIHFITYKWVTGVVTAACAMFLLITIFSMTMDKITGHAIKDGLMCVLISFTLFSESAIFDIVVKKKCYL